MDSSRFAAFKLLMKMEKNAFSNLALDGALSDINLPNGNLPSEKAFLTRLFYGVTERKITLDYIISLYSSKPPSKLDREILVILRMGLYQLLYMDAVPDSAAVNESVTLAKRAGKGSAASFVNAVLRGFIRNGKEYALPKDKMTAMSIEKSCPLPLLKALVKDYGLPNAVDLLSNALGGKKTYIRVNSLKITPLELAGRLAQIGLYTSAHPSAPDCLVAAQLTSVADNPLYKAGYFHVQDLSSQLCCAALSPKKGETVLDICAAPGGKTFTMAQMMENGGMLTACDILPKRVNLMKSGAARLGLDNIRTAVNDGTVFNPDFPLFDKILCDVPCSGFGVISGKPEIKYADLSELAGLPAIQFKILSTAAKYLKKGGALVYSTCTLSKKENDGVIERFLAENADFKGVSFLREFGEPFGDYKATVFPRHFESDGFFMAKIVRIG